MKDEGIILVISAPSGTGKGTVINHLLNEEDFVLSISSTSRKAREGEIDKEDYFFIKEDEFEKDIKEDGFLEWAKYCDNYYGTPKKYVNEQIKKGKTVILEIEVKGALQVKEKHPNAVLVFLLTPKFADLKERLRGRKTEAEEIIDKRIEEAKREIQKIEDYDYLVINNKVENAVNDILSIARSERLKISKRKHFLENFRKTI